MIPITIAIEDELSEAVALKIVDTVNNGLTVNLPPVRGGGFGKLKVKAPSFNILANSDAVLLLTDLDQADCPVQLRDAWLRNQPLAPKMLFRVAVREVEAWLLADRQSFAEFIHSPVKMIPSNPEQLDDPKQQLLHLANKYAKRKLKADLIRQEGTNLRQGLGYNEVLVQFVLEHWSIDLARKHANSLDRTVRRLEELVATCTPTDS